MTSNAWTRTTCPFCGTGCGIRVKGDGRGGIAALEGDPDHPANQGKLCGKGNKLAETLAMDGRLLHPEIRGERVSWDVALDYVAQGLADTIRAHGPDAVGFYLSGQLLTEDYYLANKLMKGFIGSANVEGNSRLCMSSAVVGHKRAFGADVVPGCYQDLELARLVVIAGSNTAWCHPLVFRRLVEARRGDPSRRLVVIDPRRTVTAGEADLHLPVRGGTDLWLWLGLLRHLHVTGRANRAFLHAHVTLDEATLEMAHAHAPDLATVARITGLEEARIMRFYELYAATEQTVTLFSQGVNQSVQGSDTVNALINCHLITGRIGKPGMGPLSLTGQPNAMGGREVGALSNQLAAHMSLESPHHRRIVGTFWNSDRIPSRPGLKAVEMFRAVDEGKIRALWIMGTNPLVSLPDGAAARRALARCPLVIVSDAARHTDTLPYAHVLLPARPWGEKDGTVTNSERRISRQRAFLPPSGEAMPDWWMMAQVGRRMGFDAAFDHADAGAVFREHALLSGFQNHGERLFDISALAGTDYDTLEPIQWPVRRAPDDSPVGVARPMENHAFASADRKARLLAIMPRVAPPAQDAAGLRLNTGRVRDQWHTMTRTGVSPTLSRHEPEPVVEIHPRDAARLGIDHDGLAKVVNDMGALLLRVRVTESQSPGHLFVPMHWSRRFAGQALVNQLIPARTDPESGQPDSKAATVSIAPVMRHWRGVLLSREPVEPEGSWWCRRALGNGVWRYDLEGLTALSDWKSQSAAWLEAGEGTEWIDYADPAHGRFRRAWRVQGRLMGCLFIEPGDALPDPSRLLPFFDDPHWSAQALLSGAAQAGARATERMICACHGVSEEAIRTAIQAGETTVEGMGRRLKAGTGCGSCVAEIRGLLAA